MSLSLRRLSRLLAVSLLVAVPADVAFGQRTAARATAARGQTILERNVRAGLEFLAGDALQGRGSATGYERIAAEYIGSQFRQFGLEPAGDTGASGAKTFVQRVPLEAPRYAEPPTLRAGSGNSAHAWHYGRDLSTFFLTAPRTAGELQVIAPEGTPSKGAVVVIKLSQDVDRQRRGELITKAYAAEAAAVILPESDANLRARESGSAALPEFPVRVRDEASEPGRPPERAFVAIMLRQGAFEELAALPAGTRVEFGGATLPVESAASWNAVGVLRGADPKASGEVILLSAHLDHLGLGRPVDGDAIYNGADDDASGCVAVLELARALASGPRPRRTIYFVCFGGEEKGGYGSRYFLQHAPVPLQRIAANINFEMLGRPDPKVPPGALWLTGYDRSNLGPELARQGVRLVADPHPEMNFFQRSDNYALALRGVVAHTVSSFGLHPDYHRPGDEAAKIDFKFLAQSIQSLVRPIRWLSESSFRPSWRKGRAPSLD